MINISQVTNFSDIVTSAPTVYKNVTIGGQKQANILYYVLDTSILSSSFPILKLGYCCEPKGIGYPIFLTIENSERKFEVGKTGMFEFQKDEWRDVNKDPNEIYTSEIFVTEVKIPAKITFTLDYCYDNA